MAGGVKYKLRFTRFYKTGEAKMEQRLKLKSDLAELDKLHNYIERFGRKLCLSKKYVVEINLVLEEVFSNIVAYAYEDRGEHFIKISVIPSGNGNIVLRVEDKGRPFNPLDATQPDMTYDLEHCEIGGLGIHLVKNLMDDVRYDYRDDKNVLEMKKSVASTCRQSSNTAD
jgi:serine/threonine-protein kinase RsbW